MKILITGAQGFVGSYISNQLIKTDHEIFAPKRSEMDCSDLQSVKNIISCINPDIIFHTAAFILPTDEMPGRHKEILENNKEINSNILGVAASDDVMNVVCFGSHTMYSPGIPKKEVNIFEGESPSFIRGYSESKRLLLKECESYSHDGLNYKMLILPSIYGPFPLQFSPKQMLNSIIVRAMDLKKNNQKFLDVRGDTMALKEYIFLPDLWTWLFKNLDLLKKIPPALNLGTQSTLPILEYYNLCARLLDIELSFDKKITPKSNEKVFDYALDSSLAFNFGWGATTPIEEGIMQTISYIEGKYGI